MSYLSSDPSKELYDQHSNKTNIPLFPQYQYKKNLNSPSKIVQNFGTSENSDTILTGSTNPNSLQSFNMQPTPISSMAFGIPEIKNQVNMNSGNTQGGIPVSTIGIGQSYLGQSPIPQLKNMYSNPQSQQREDNFGIKNEQSTQPPSSYGAKPNIPVQYIGSISLNSNTFGIQQQLAPQNSIQSLNKTIAGNNTTNQQLSNINNPSSNASQPSLSSENASFFQNPSSQQQSSTTYFQQNTPQYSQIDFTQQVNPIISGFISHSNQASASQINQLNQQIFQSNSNMQTGSQNSSSIQNSDLKNIQGGQISMNSSSSGLPSNIFITNTAAPLVIPSNDNLSAIVPNDSQMTTNNNYFNFQDFSITSQTQYTTNTKIPQNSNNAQYPLVIDSQSSTNQKLQNQQKQSQLNKQKSTNNIQLPQNSPHQSNIQNKSEIGNKITSLTANNTPYKSQMISSQSAVSTAYKSEIKQIGSHTPSLESNYKTHLVGAQSPGRQVQVSTKFGGTGYDSGIQNQTEQNVKSRYSQHQKSNTGSSSQSINQKAATCINSPSSPQQTLLLPTQQQLVQSIVLQRNVSQSPSNLKQPSNFSQILPSTNKQQTKLQTPTNNLTASYLINQYSNINIQQSLTANTAKNSRTMISMSPDNRVINQIGQQNNTGNSALNGNKLSQQGYNSLNPSSQSSQQSSSQNNYYKVASQIRRNQLKERRPSLINSQSTSNTGVLLSTKGGNANGNQASQININASINAGVALTHQSSLTYSQNYGKALPINDLQKQQYLKQQQSETQQKSSTTLKRQNSGGSQGRKSQEIKDSHKRFTVVDKFNEKYTKKLIIDLCNYMNYSNDGNPENGGKQQNGAGNIKNVDEEDQVKRTNALTKDSKGNWTNNNNMNVLDILCQQRVLHRSISNQKRMTSNINNENGLANKHINVNNPNFHHLYTPSKSSSSSATKRFSFRQTDKPWENTSFHTNTKFNSKYGSFSVMRSMNNSQSNWNLNGSQNLNSSTSSLKNGEIQSTLSNLRTHAQQASSNQIGSEQGLGLKKYKKRMSNNFILAAFNESQEINSSRNQKVNNKLKSKIGNPTTDSKNLLTKNITADLTTHSTNPKNKYKFSSNSNTHLSKATTSSNAFEKQQKSSQTKQRESSNSDANSQLKVKKSTLISKDNQVHSPLPTTLPNSKNSTKSEIKKSQLVSNPSSQTNKNRFSDNTYSQQESFEKYQEGAGFDREGEEEEYYENNGEEDDNEEDEDEEEQSISGGSNSSSSKANTASNHNISGNPPNHQETNNNNFHTHGRTNNNAEQFRQSVNIPVSAYHFESNLEHLPGVQINIEELRKERQKLIRKITSTFKVKNKALSTSQEYYKVLHVIGKGAFAKVCLAIQLLTGKFVAIKLIDKQILRSESAKKRVLQEVQILKKLNNHKHVLKLLEVFENRKLIFIVTEYFRGQDLMKMMKERNGEPYTENQVRHMLTQILSGLRYIHGNMVLHRDIKLDNLLVDSQLNLKVIDFGISRIIQKDQKMMEQCGTPAFLAPEIIANKGYEGFGSDMWSLGVLIYILLFGKVPFKGNNLSELHRNILNGILPLDEMRDTNVSFEAQDLLQRILKLKVKDRANLEDIINSPWMRGYLIPDGIENKELSQQKSPVHDLHHDHFNKNTQQSNEQFDEKIIGYIEGFGYSKEYIQRCLNKSGLSHVNALYKILKNNSTQISHTYYQ